MTVRRIMRPKVNADTVTAFASHKSFPQSKWKEEERASYFRFVITMELKDIREDIVGNQHRTVVIIVEINKVAGSTMKVINSGQRFHGNLQDGNKSKPKWRNEEVLSVQKRPQVKEGLEILIHQCCPTFLCTRAQFTDAYGGAGATTYYYYHHHLIRTTTTTTTTNNNNINNKIIRNLILTKSFVNIIIFTYNTIPCFKEIL
jgi:hypothetical protein